jgi:hypothetical protein
LTTEPPLKAEFKTLIVTVSEVVAEPPKEQVSLPFVFVPSVKACAAPELFETVYVVALTDSITNDESKVIEADTPIFGSLVSELIAEAKPAAIVEVEGLPEGTG